MGSHVGGQNQAVLQVSVGEDLIRKLFANAWSFFGSNGRNLQRFYLVVRDLMNTKLIRQVLQHEPSLGIFGR
jgi:hypothetical protein